MGKVNPTAWVRVPVGGTQADPSVYTAIREALQEVSDSAKYLQADIDNLRSKVTSPGSSVVSQTVISDGSGGGGGGGGSVTSVGLSAPSEFSVSGSPVTLAGTLSLSWASQTANKVFASPNGSTGTPAFRALVDADLGSTSVVYTTGSYSNPAWITSLAGSKISGDISGNAANVNGVVTETHGGTGESTYTLGDTLYSDATNSLAKLSGNTTTTKKFLTQTGTGSASAAPSWGTISGSDVTGSDLTKTDDTNVTLTLGGTPVGSLLKAVSITAGWTGQLAVSRGGTGLSSLGTANQVLGVNNGVTALEYKSVNAGTGISVTHGAGTITVANTGVTSVTGTSPVASTGGATPAISLNAAYGDTLNPYGSKTANFVLAAPDGVAGVPSFRSLVAADIPNISAAKITSGTLALARGGTGADLSATGGTGQYVKQATAGGVFTVGNIPASDIASGAALTKGDDTNVTLSLSGSPASALLAATTITAGWTGQLAVSRGGTGIGTAPTNGQLLIGNGTGYTLAGLTQGSNVTITTGAGSITISATGNMTNPMTTIGDMIYASNTATPATPARLGLTTGGVMYGGASAPAWTATADATWDQTNKRFGLGTSSPQVRLHVDDTASTLDTDLYNNTDLILAVNDAGTGLRLVSATSDPTTIGNTPALVWLTGRGTPSAATAVSSGDYLGRLLVQGIATGGGRQVATEIRAAVDAAPGTSFVPGRFEFFTTNSSGTQAERMRLTSDGYLGIGKTPSTVLDIVHTVAGNAAVNMANSSADPAANARFILNNSATSGGLQIRSSAHASEPSDLVLYSSANNIRFYTNGNLRGTVLSNGNFTYDTDTFFIDAANNRVGIGTTSAFAKLDFGDTNATFNTTTPGTTRYGIHFQSGATNDYSTGITWAGNGTGGGAAQAGIYVQSSDAYGTKMYFATTGVYATGAQTAMMIDQNRRVGIGTTSPAYIFDVAETSANAATAKIMQRNILTMNPTALSIALGDAFNSQMVLNGSANNFTVRQSAGTFSVSHTGTGTVTRADGVTVLAFSKATAGTITALSAFRADSPSVSSGTVTASYGLYVDTMKTAGVTTGYGVYQASTSDLNILAGSTRVGSTTSPTALLHLAAGTATASTAPLKFTSGTNLSALEAGAVEYDGTLLYYTDGTPARQTLTRRSDKLSVFAATTSSELAGVISDETGSGALVFATSPVLTTPSLGAATATSINKVTITAPASSATLTIADTKTLTVNNTLTFTGTDSSSVAFGAGGTVAYTANKLSVFAATSSSELASVISDETGSGALVFGTTPTLNTPALAGETFSTSNTVTAGANSQGSGPLTSDYNVVTITAANPSGVTLPTATTGRRVIVFNKGTNPINVYPASGGTIDALALNASIQIPVGNGMEFNAASTTQWYSTFNLLVSGSAISGTITGYLALSGGTMSGLLNMGNQNISNVNNITIGTATVDTVYTLDVNDTDATVISARVKNGTSTAYTVLSVEGNTAKTNIYTSGSALAGSAPFFSNNTSSIEGTGAGGLYMVASDAAGIFSVLTGGLTLSSRERLRVTSGGVVIIGNGEAGTTPAGNTLRAPSGAGTNIAGGSLTVTAGNGTGTGGSGSITFQTAPVGSSGTTANTMATRLTINTAGSVIIGSAALATNATDGFLYIPGMAGAPTSAPPTAVTGRVPVVYDTTNNKLYVYNGAWKSVTLA